MDMLSENNTQPKYTPPLDDSRLTPLERSVYICICLSGAEGATWDEIHKATGIPKGSLSPRFRPLRESGYIQPKLQQGLKVMRKGSSKRGQTVWIAKD